MDANRAPPTRTEKREVLHFASAQPRPGREERQLLTEAPLAVELRDGPTYTLMRTPGPGAGGALGAPPAEGSTRGSPGSASEPLASGRTPGPGADRELVAGFLLTEGLIRSLDDIQVLEECADDPARVRVALAAGAAEAAGRTLAVTSSCGRAAPAAGCGREGLDSLVEGIEPVTGGPEVDVAVLYALPERVRAAQTLFEATGASHAAALFDADGRVLVVREDIGRHNALDKVLGHALLSGMDLPRLGVFLSGRASLEMVAKSGRAGVALLAAVSAPSAAAVEAAGRLGLTLCGFVRGTEVTVYAHPERVRGAA